MGIHSLCQVPFAEFISRDSNFTSRIFQGGEKHSSFALLVAHVSLLSKRDGFWDSHRGLRGVIGSCWEDGEGQGCVFKSIRSFIPSSFFPQHRPLTGLH